MNNGHYLDDGDPDRYDSQLVVCDALVDDLGEEVHHLQLVATLCHGTVHTTLRLLQEVVGKVYCTRVRREGEYRVRLLVEIFKKYSTVQP